MGTVWRHDIRDCRAYTKRGAALLEYWSTEGEFSVKSCLPMEVRALFGLEEEITSMDPWSEHTGFIGDAGENMFSSEFTPNEAYNRYLQQQYGTTVLDVIDWRRLTLDISIRDGQVHVSVKPDERIPISFKYLALSGIDFSVQSHEYTYNSQASAHFRIGMRYDFPKLLFINIPEKNEKIDRLLQSDSIEYIRQGCELLRGLNWEYSELCEYFDLPKSNCTFIEIYQRFYDYPHKWMILSYFWIK